MAGRSAMGRGPQLTKSMAWSHWRNSSHHEGSIAAGVEAIVVRTEVEVENAAPRRTDFAGDLESGFSEQVDKLSNKPLHGRGPVNSRSTFNEPGPRGSSNEA